MDRINLAVMGLGKIARDQHLPSIAADPRFHLAAIVSGSQSVDGVPAFKTLDALLDAGPALDAIAICTPPQPRYGYARQALEAGLHVMLEKPPTPTVSEFAALADFAKAKARTLHATWHSRHAPMVGPARAWLAGKTWRSVEIVWKENVRQWHPGQTWLWEPGGLGVFDPAINAFSILTSLAPDPVFVRSADFDVPENAHTPIRARLDMACGAAPIRVDLDFLQEGEQTWDIRIETDGGRLVLSLGASRMRIDDGEETSAPDLEYPDLYDAFAGLIAAGRSDADDRPLRLVADAFMLARTRRVEAFHD